MESRNSKSISRMQQVEMGVLPTEMRKELVGPITEMELYFVVRQWGGIRYSGGQDNCNTDAQSLGVPSERGLAERTERHRMQTPT
jgi:hypothetical protein